MRGIGSDTVWAAGNSGTVVKTVNAGATWATLPKPSGLTSQMINCIFFTDASTGWLGSINGIVKKTTDGGTTWISQDAALPTLDPGTGVYSMWFTDNDSGYLSGDAGVLRRTLNSGAEWSSVQYGTFSALQAMQFTDDLNG